MKTTKQKKDEFINQGSEIEKELLSIFGKNDPITIADIGACEGLSTIIYSRIFKNARFISFEPIKENYDEMVDNYFQYGILSRVDYLFPCALSDGVEKVPIWRSSGQAPGVEDWETGNKSSSILEPKKHLTEHGWCKFQKSTPIDCCRLDDIMRKIDKVIDFAHIDVQGAELKVLRGGKETFKNTMAIWLEVANVELYAGQPLKGDIQKYMDAEGFKCIKDTCGNKKYGDMLFIRKQL